MFTTSSGWLDLLPQLTSQLEAQVSLAKTLLGLLEGEARVVTCSDPKAILDLAHRKQEIAEHLEQVEKSRSLCLENYGLPVALSLLEQTLLHAGATQAAATCKELSQIALACFESNRTNGILVESRFRHARHALEIVAGHSPANDSYGPSRKSYGTEKSRSAGRSWATV
ncbi:flagella synthesis protein FlgN [Gammaproteobacteria bacterium]